MTRDEVIKVLQDIPENLPVVAEWDMGFTDLQVPELLKDDKGNPVIVFDVTDYNSHERDP